jgi:uncharacterized protein with HEPN domain
MREDDLVRLRHMLDAARDATSFAENRRRQDLLEDRMLTLALVRSIEIIGEAGSRVSDESRHEIADIPWRAIVAMRNRLIHAYFDVDLDVAWSTVHSDLPPLISRLERALHEDER